MSNSFDYLFKFILIGDSSTSFLIQVLASRVSLTGLSRASSGANMIPPLAFSLDVRMLLLMARHSESRSGIQYPFMLCRQGRSPSSPSPGPTTKAQLQPFSSLILPAGRLSKTLTNGSLRLKIIPTKTFKWSFWATRPISP
jgi:hypothetical protein